ncbi:MAG: DUF1800 domain-containing protein [Pseudomonadales bacterium]|nr:DUF1800 domain-containing protein [Pseudomonadales bacterium]
MATIPDQAQHAVIAVNRFGLGARPRDLVKAAKDPQLWLKNQMFSPQLNSQLADTKTAFEQFSAHRKIRGQQKKSAKMQVQSMMLEQPTADQSMSMQIMKSNKSIASGQTRYAKLMRQTQKNLLIDSLWQSVETTEPFSMRLLDFFSNHFSVSSSTALLKVVAPLLEREAIAPHLFGHFEDMLIAVMKHPAMLMYLDNARSTGPNSRAGRYNKKRGINENLAREIFELHTLGVDGGYHIGDIQELAKALTGWSVSYPADQLQEGFIFREKLHEPGTRIILAKRYRHEGQRQVEAILKALARHPSTAKFLSYKLACHFISDQPDPDLVSAMATRWQDSKGNLSAVMTTLIEHPSSWQLQRQKFKTPREFVVSTLRSVGLEQKSARGFLTGLVYHLTEMGQAPFSAGSPAGYSTYAKDWSGSDALIKRIDWVNRLVTVSPKLSFSALDLAKQLFADDVSERTLKVLAGAETARQAYTMLFMSPEFQRR